MHLVNSPISVGDDTFTSDEMERLANDPNCKRSYMGKTLEEIVTPGTTWHRISKDGKWAGAFLLDTPDAMLVCTHICAFEGKLSREEAIIATQLSAKISIIRGLHPYTTVSQEPQYDYMRKFLEDCGFVKNRFDSMDMDVYVVGSTERFNILYMNEPYTAENEQHEH